MPKTRKIQAGVSFAPAIMDYIDRLRTSEEPLFRRRTRSDVINLIIEDHANRTGRRIQSPDTEASANGQRPTPSGPPLLNPQPTGCE